MSEHNWKTYGTITACSVCGVCLRADKQNKPCSGTTPRIETRTVTVNQAADWYLFGSNPSDQEASNESDLTTEDREALAWLVELLGALNVQQIITDADNVTDRENCERSLAVLSRLVERKP